MKRLFTLCLLTGLLFGAKAQVSYVHLPLDYMYNGTQYANTHGLGYGGQNWFINNQYAYNDSSPQLLNYTQDIMRYAAAVFDTLLYKPYSITEDNYLFYPLAKSTITVDSLHLFFKYTHNLPGVDTIRFTVFNTSAATISGYGTANGNYITPKLWDTTLYVSSTIAGNPFYMLPVYPHVTLPKGQSFGVRYDYSGSKGNTFMTSFYSLVNVSCACSSTQSMEGRTSVYYEPFDSAGLNRSTLSDNVHPTIYKDCDQNNQLTPGSCEYPNTQDLYAQAYVDMLMDYGVTFTVFTVGGTKYCSENTVELISNAFGGAHNYTYNWSTDNGYINNTNTAQTTLVFGNVTSPTTITLTVTDANNATTSYSQTIQPDTVCGSTFTARVNNWNSVCPGSKLILYAQTYNGVPPFRYHWSSQGNPLSCDTCRFPQITLNNTSTITLNVTDAHGTVATDVRAIGPTGGGNVIPTLGLKQNNIDCTVKLDSAVVTVSTAGPYNFYWGDGTSFTSATAPGSHPYNHPGIYVIEVLDGNGCANSILDTVVNTGVQVSLVQSLTTECLDINTGGLVVAASGGVPPYTYHWSNGATGNTINNLPAKSYVVTVSDANNCTTDQRFYIDATDWYYYTFLNNTNANCGNNGSIIPMVNGGTPPYSYLWNNNTTADSLINLGAGIYSVTITDSLGCATSGTARITQGCASVITGYIFVDKNHNCQYDESERIVPNIPVIASANTGGASYYGNTNIAGHFSVTVPDTGLYTMYTPANSCGLYKLCSTSGSSVDVPAQGDTLHYNFAISDTDANNGYDLAIHPGWLQASPGFQKQYWVFYYNLKPVTSPPATVTFNYDPGLVYQSSSPPATADTINHTLTWNVGPVVGNTNIGQSQQLHAYFMVPANTNPNDILVSDFKISPTDGDCNLSNNEYSYSERITSSHDPNAKEVIPANNVFEDDSVLRYTIHFQNTGTDSTWFIIVTDTLPPTVDPATVENIASSHTYTDFSISGTGILTWVFNPLRLVDSATDPINSTGFVMFTVKLKASRAVGSVISNTAAIVFDYNTPVMTNKAVDTISISTGVQTVTIPRGVDLKVFPNPANDKLYIAVTGYQPQWITVYDMNGSLLSQQRFVPQIDIHTLPAGVYFIEVKGGGDVMRSRIVKM